MKRAVRVQIGVPSARRLKPGLVALGVAACAGAPAIGPAPVVVPVQPPLPVPTATTSAPAKADVPAASPDVVPPPFVVGSAIHGKTPPLREAPKRTLTARWSTRVGKTTFRTTMAMAGDKLVIGTHGDSLKGLNEASDGVYVLDAKTGKVVKKIAPPGTGDKDVGGIALEGNSVVFGTDNGYVVRAGLDGVTAWTTKLGGKIRPAPALARLRASGALDVVVGDENGTLHALDGDTGKPLWTRDTGKNDYDAGGFIAGAAIARLDGDTIDDVIAGARDGVLVAYAGRDGQELWRYEGGSGIHASPSIVDLDGDGRMEVISAWSYSTVVVFDAKTGEVRWEQALEQDDVGIEGLFASPIPVPRKSGGVVVQPTSWWGGKRGASASTSVDGIILVGQERRAFRTAEGRVSATAVVMDLDDDGSWDAIVGTEAGDLLALDAERGTRTVLAKANGGIEAPALVADVDGDGTYELLVASNDGMLTCYATGSKTKPLVPRFRGATPDNRGQLGSISVGWKVSTEAVEPRPALRKH